MVINWTKIIILIIIIAAFAGIIVGIVLAFRVQCPDGKIFDKTCKKCVTKCPDGYKLIPEGDCNSTTCAIDCKDRCRIDNDTCGDNCGSDCCNKNESCDFSEQKCKTNNCPKGPNAEIFCEPPGVCISSPGTNLFAQTTLENAIIKLIRINVLETQDFVAPMILLVYRENKMVLYFVAVLVLLFQIRVAVLKKDLPKIITAVLQIQLRKKEVNVAINHFVMGLLRC